MVRSSASASCGSCPICLLVPTNWSMLLFLSSLHLTKPDHLLPHVDSVLLRLTFAQSPNMRHVPFHFTRMPIGHLPDHVETPVCCSTFHFCWVTKPWCIISSCSIGSIIFSRINLIREGCTKKNRKKSGLLPNLYFGVLKGSKMA